MFVAVRGKEELSLSACCFRNFSLAPEPPGVFVGIFLGLGLGIWGYERGGDL